jgi:hypothetical protein
MLKLYQRRKKNVNLKKNGACSKICFYNTLAIEQKQPLDNLRIRAVKHV